MCSGEVIIRHHDGGRKGRPARSAKTAYKEVGRRFHSRWVARRAKASSKGPGTGDLLCDCDGRDWLVSGASGDRARYLDVDMTMALARGSRDKNSSSWRTAQGCNYWRLQGEASM